jgi:peptide subunit release factor 1 (eRF1)
MENLRQTLFNLQLAKPNIRGTTLITYMIPGSTDIWLVTKHLNNEICTAHNIKSKQVRSSVIDALKSLLISFECFCQKGKVPKNGLVMLAGSLISPNPDEIPYYL